QADAQGMDLAKGRPASYLSSRRAHLQESTRPECLRPDRASRPGQDARWWRGNQRARRRLLRRASRRHGPRCVASHRPGAQTRAGTIRRRAGAGNPRVVRPAMGKSAWRLLLPLAAAALLLLSLAALGRWARESLRQEDRYRISFAAIQCQPPPGPE